MYLSPGLESRMLHGESESCIKIKVNWKCCFNVIKRGAASEMVKWKTGLSSQRFIAALGFSRTRARYLFKVFENTRSIIFENTRSILRMLARVLTTRMRFLVRGQIALDSLSLELARYTMSTFIRGVLYIDIAKGTGNFKL